MSDSSGWDIVKPRERPQPEPPEWDVYRAPERAEVSERDRIRAELESTGNRFRDFLAILTDFQWPQAAPEIAAAIVDLESWPHSANPLKSTLTRLTMSKTAAGARFEAAHRRLLQLLDQTKDPLLAEKDFPSAGRAVLAHMDRVNRRLAGL